jgi:transposase
VFCFGVHLIMSLHPHALEPIPAVTAQTARAAFPKGNPYLTLRDELGPLYRDEDFADLFPARGQPGLPPWRLALVTVMQFRENLSDRQAAEAVRARIDWKYLLGLELTDPGFDFSVLSEFRARLLAGAGEECLLNKLLDRCRGIGLLKARGQQRTDATHVLAAIRVLNRLELVAETLRAALNELATLAPDWLKTWAPADWYDRYGRRIEDTRLPRTEAERTAYAEQVGEDGWTLLDAVAATPGAWGLHDLPHLVTLRQAWDRHYERLEASPPGAMRRVRFKTPRELGRAAEGLESPYDPEARYRRKRGDLQWTGYMVHLTETCEAEALHLITQVTTTPATVHEVNCTASIQQALMKQGWAPREHLVDAAYVDAEGLVESFTERGILLVGPPRLNPSWQSRVEGAYTLDQFEIDWAQRQVRCPQGKVSVAWSEQVPPTRPAPISVRFRADDCAACPARALCTRSALGPRHLNLFPPAQYEALRAMRERLASEAGRQLYARRAGIEGTLSQGVRTCGLRRTRYRGRAKTHLQQIGIATALNIDRLFAWQQHRPHAKTRTSRFARLRPAS